MRSSLRIPPSATRYDVVQLGGGLDQLTPVLRLKPGMLRDSVNVEQSITGGYTRIGGYERFAGGALPSSAGYTTVLASTLSGLVVGNVATGAASAATGTILSITGLYVAIGNQTGTFSVGEALIVGGSNVGTVASLGDIPPDPAYDAAQRALAANLLRASVPKVPGAGPVRGGIELNGVCYAWRNAVGNASMAIWRAVGNAWVAVPLGSTVAFSAGSIEPVVGATITQGANSATVKAVSMEGGDWLAGTASGRLVISAPAPGNFVAGAVTGLTLGGASTPTTLLPNGRIETDLGNFGSGVKAYGIDGVNSAFEFDGYTYVPIHTAGNLPDVPSKVLVHSDHLFLAFGSSLQHSGIGAPFNWTSVAGAAEYRCDGTITALTRQPGSQGSGTMSIATSSGTEMLYGKSAADFNKVSFEQSAGARPYGTQRIGGQTLQYGDTGVVSVSASQNYGNFAPASMTLNIRPFTQVRRTNCTASSVNREKSQFRVFFADNYGLYLTVANGRLVGVCPVFFPDRVLCTWDRADLSGNETSFFGSDDGYVYVLDSGTSHDGEAIYAFGTLTFASQGNSRVMKRYRGVEFEVQGDGYARFSTTYEVGYGVVGSRSQGDQPNNVAVTLSTVHWDEFTWDQFTWDGRSLAPSHCELAGTGENIAIRFESSSDAYLPFTLNSAIIHYSFRKALKS